MTTRRDPRERPADDFVKLHFRAERAKQLWVADVTYASTCAGFISLAMVMEVFRRRIVGWSMDEHMTTQLAVAALNMALAQREHRDAIHHSDQGSQCTSSAFGQRCAEMGVLAPMGIVGDAEGSAMA